MAEHPQLAAALQATNLGDVVHAMVAPVAAKGAVLQWAARRGLTHASHILTRESVASLQTQLPAVAHRELMTVLRALMAEHWQGLGIETAALADMPPAGAKQDQWKAWLATLGLGELAARPVSCVVAAAEAGISPWMVDTTTVAAALAGSGSYGYGMTPKDKFRLQTLVCEGVQRLAQDLTRGVATAHAVLALPVPEETPQIGELVRMVDAAIAAARGPLGIWPAIAHVELAAAPGVETGESPAGGMLLRAHVPSAWCHRDRTVDWQIALTTEGPESTPARALVARNRCAIHDRGCPWMLGALVAMRRSIASPEHRDSNSAMASLALAEPWQRALNYFQLATLDGEAKDDGELGWRVTLEGQHLKLGAVALVMGKKGLKLVSIAQHRVRDWVAEHPDRVLPGDRLAAYLYVMRNGVEYVDEALDVYVTVLRGLIGHPRLFGPFGSEPWTLVTAPASIEIVRDRGMWSVEVLRANGVLGDRVQRLTLAAKSSWHATVDPATRTFTLVEIPDKVRKLAGSVLRCAGRFPIDAGPMLGSALIPLRTEHEVQVPEALLGKKVAPHCSPTVRLTPKGDLGMEVEIRVRPLPAGALYPPGQGSLQPNVVLADGGQYCTRDFDREATWARQLQLRLGLGDQDSDVPAWSWLVTGADAALDVIAELSPPPDGVDVLWPDPSQRKAVARAAKETLRVEMASKNDWFSVQGGLQVAQHKVPLDRVLDAIRAGRRYVAADAQTMVRLEESLRRALQPLADLGSRKGKVEVGAMHALLLEDLDLSGEAPRKWRQMVGNMRAAQASEPAIPADLRAELRPYQRVGVQWLLRLSAWAPGAVLADDMGLGKTVQALAVLLQRKAHGPALVVAPLSLVHNWQREADKFAPGLRMRPLHELDDGDLKDLRPADVVVCSWDRMVRRIDQLTATPWATLVFDEAQALKNATTKRAQSAFQLQASFRMALSGTPVENRTAELWSVLRAAVPGLLGSWEDFRDRFASPIERNNDPAARTALARLIRPFVLRRRKAEVAPELPPRTEIRLDVEQSEEERALYEAHRQAALRMLEDSRRMPPEQRRFAVLAALTRMRQLACHPGLVDEFWSGSSAKLDALVERLAALRDEGHKALVFSQFVRHLDLVKDALVKEGFNLRYLDGQTPIDARKQEVDRFQSGDGDAFLISLKAGGTGLNLTAASYVFHLDPWWNPAVEDQATDRAHRIGQDRAVTVYRLVTQNTVEEGILRLHGEKRQLVEGLLEGTSAGAAIGVDELESVLRGDVAMA
ncbi:MAG: DEAD/DEAH box helicase [Deltaproteobacteria bacterium]|nr:DEAD/DEAH box helicase [Deltaproteobacteria bacterium]